MPTFYATALRRLPPVDASHCDVSAILKELQGLRTEVRLITELRSEVNKLQQEVRQIDELKDQIGKLQKEVGHLISKSEMPSMHAEIPSMSVAYSEYPPLCSFVSESSNHHTTPLITSSLSPISKPTTAQIVMAAASSGALDSQPAAQRTARPQKFVVGKLLHQKLQSARVLKSVDIFVTRLLPDTSCDEVLDCVTDILKVKQNLPSSNIKCEKLKTKFDSYASFSVTVLVSEDIRNEVIGLLMSDDCWPQGVLVRKFYRKRNGGQ